MAPKKMPDEQAMNALLEQFLQTQHDVPTVHSLDQRLELHLTGTSAYLPSYTRKKMDDNHGAPVMAVHTKTDTVNKRVYFYPAEDPEEKAARKLRSGKDSFGPATFAFGVPLRKLKLQLPENRRYVLPINTLDVPKQGTVYWVGFTDLEHELRSTMAEIMAAAANRNRPQTTRKKNPEGQAPAGA